MINYTRKKGIVYKNQFHIIFCPKYRRKVLINGIDDIFKYVFLDIAQKEEIDIKAMEIMPDHAHLFIEFDPRKSLHSVIKALKGKSSNILRNEFPELKSKIPSLWTRSYFDFYFVKLNDKVVEKYIEQQKGV